MLLSQTLFALELSTKQMAKVKQVFPTLTSLSKKLISDPISENPINTALYSAFQGTKHLGYIRPIETTTGCKSACLPISYMAFYTSTGDYLKLKSIPGLTKINHTPFTPNDYAELDLVLVLVPEELSRVEDPKDMTDALSGATSKQFEKSVVKGAAYSTLRIHKYNQQTIKQILSKDLK